jgi:hypothetical protein
MPNTRTEYVVRNKNTGLFWGKQSDDMDLNECDAKLEEATLYRTKWDAENARDSSKGEEVLAVTLTFTLEVQP